MNGWENIFGVLAAVGVVIAGLLLNEWSYRRAQAACDRINEREKQIQREWQEKFKLWKWGCGECPGPPPPAGPYWYVA